VKLFWQTGQLTSPDAGLPDFPGVAGLPGDEGTKAAFGATVSFKN
jgi:hypothetical protein